MLHSRSSIDILQLVQWRDYSRYRRCDGLVAILHRFVAGWSSARPYPASDCHVSLKRRERLQISAIIRRTLLTCGTVLITDQTLWISVEHATSSWIMCAHMRACARTLFRRASPPPKQKMEKMEKTKRRKRWKILLWVSLLSSDRNLKRRRCASYTHRVLAQERGTAGPLSLLILLIKMWLSRLFLGMC